MPDPTVQRHPFLFQPPDEPPVAAEWGYLSVPENRRRAATRQLTLPFVRFPATTKTPAAPIIFLQGGPGGSVLPNLQWLWQAPMVHPAQQIADFIYIEQRGSGLSQPLLDCPGSYDLPLDEPGDPGRTAEIHRQYLERALTFWREQGIDPAGYNAREMAADIDDLRQALGYDSWTLTAGSFGSHHSLALLRYYGRSIERVLIWSVEGPDDTMKLPSTIQRHLEKLNGILQADPALQPDIPDLLALIARVLDRLAREPVTVAATHPLTNEPVKLTIGKHDLQVVTAAGLGNTNFLRALPRRYLALDRGEYDWLATQVLRQRTGVRSNLMEELVDMASGATATRQARIASEAKDTLLADAINEPFFACTDLLEEFDLGDDFRGPLVSDVPVVMAAGTLDFRTPLANAQALLPNLARGQLVTINGVSHDLAVRGDHIEAFAQARNRFLGGESFGPSTLTSSFTFDAAEESA